ncbi:MAG: hypothetical protein ACREDL_16445, partial [Bradyrhizobium sp.]
MTIAVSNEFLLAFSAVQKSHQKKVREFFEKFSAHPDSEGIHLEPIQSARDKNFYSARIDQAYRAVVAKPEPNLYVLMWVDNHEEAYRWAERKRLDVNPATAAVQIIDTSAVEAAGSSVAAQPQKGRLFAQVKDK